MKVSYRRYQEGDVYAINDLYRLVTGRERTQDQYAWQWLGSPAGASEIWLLETASDDGKKLIGHHGVMAEEFTCRGKLFRVGKTENTMVLPEYRDKILYLRFEKKFLACYQNRFDALFSTTGPASAIRLREALGYKSKNRWIKIYFCTEPSLSFNLLRKKFFKYQFGLEHKLENLFGIHSFERSKISLLSPECLSFDFDEFWNVASHRYGLTPNRTKKNLSWRFWKNPYRKYYTLILENPVSGTGVCVLSVRNQNEIFIDDIFCEYPENTQKLIALLYFWFSSKLRNFILTSNTTEDCLRLFESPYTFKKSWLHVLARRASNVENKMPRKITVSGESKALDEDTEWYITPFIYEGY